MHALRSRNHTGDLDTVTARGLTVTGRAPSAIGREEAVTADPSDRACGGRLTPTLTSQRSALPSAIARAIFRQAVRSSSRNGPSGSLESRTAIASARPAISTQSLPEPLLRVALRQCACEKLTGLFMGLPVLLGDISDQVRRVLFGQRLIR